jgi:hypothetical protein
MRVLATVTSLDGSIDADEKAELQRLRKENKHCAWSVKILKKKGSLLCQRVS